jgi:hypothetical protein
MYKHEKKKIVIVKFFKGKGLGILFGQFWFSPSLEVVLNGTTQLYFHSTILIINLRSSSSLNFKSYNATFIYIKKYHKNRQTFVDSKKTHTYLKP